MAHGYRMSIIDRIYCNGKMFHRYIRKYQRVQFKLWIRMVVTSGNLTVSYGHLWTTTNFDWYIIYQRAIFHSMLDCQRVIGDVLTSSWTRRTEQNQIRIATKINEQHLQQGQKVTQSCGSNGNWHTSNHQQQNKPFDWMVLQIGKVVDAKTKWLEAFPSLFRCSHHGKTFFWQRFIPWQRPSGVMAAMFCFTRHPEHLGSILIYTLYVLYCIMIILYHTCMIILQSTIIMYIYIYIFYTYYIAITSDGLLFFGGRCGSFFLLPCCLQVTRTSRTSTASCWPVLGVNLPRGRFSRSWSWSSSTGTLGFSWYRCFGQGQRSNMKKGVPPRQIENMVKHSWTTLGPPCSNYTIDIFVSRDRKCWYTWTNMKVRHPSETLLRSESHSLC